MQVLSAGHTAAHWASSKNPMHSVHFAGSILKQSPLNEIAWLGHWDSHAEQAVHWSLTIMYGILFLLWVWYALPTG
jgi:hypothetical protein